MHWFDWVMVALFTINVVMCALMIGKPREPLTMSNFIGVLIINTLMVTGIFLTRL